MKTALAVLIVVPLLLIPGIRMGQETVSVSGTFSPVGPPVDPPERVDAGPTCIVDLKQRYEVGGDLSGEMEVDFRILVEGPCGVPAGTYEEEWIAYGVFEGNLGVEPASGSFVYTAEVSNGGEVTGRMVMGRGMEGELTILGRFSDGTLSYSGALKKSEGGAPPWRGGEEEATFLPPANGGYPPEANAQARQISDRMLAGYDPYLLRQAEERGIYDRTRFPVLRDINPFFIRGDFNGDGEMDLAFWVQEGKSGPRGVAIVHSTLDTLYLFGAGRPGPPPHRTMGREGRVDAWHLLPVGYVETSPYGSIPAVGLREGTPFTFERETLEFVFLGKSAFVYYWAEGRYWEFWTAD